MTPCYLQYLNCTGNIYLLHSLLFAFSSVIVIKWME